MRERKGLRGAVLSLAFGGVPVVHDMDGHESGRVSGKKDWPGAISCI